MKLYIEKDRCKVTESMNGHALIVETNHPMLIDTEYGVECLMCPADHELGGYGKPVPRKDRYALPNFVQAPEDITI